MTLPIILGAALNSASYVNARAKERKEGKDGVTLDEISISQNGVQVYLVAGCGNQPRQAFDFILPDFLDHGYGVTLVNYHPGHGCDMRMIAEQVVTDVKWRQHTKVLIVGISIGDYVGRVVESALPDKSYTIAICPEPDARLLKPWARIALGIGVPLAAVATLAAGWLSKIRWYTDCGNHFSSTFMVSQFAAIASVKDAPRTSERMLGAIIAEYDKFLRGREAMEAYFGEGVPIYTAVEASHGNTVKQAELYRRAWNDLWKAVEPILLEKESKSV